MNYQPFSGRDSVTKNPAVKQEVCDMDGKISKKLQGSKKAVQIRF
ncbi:hypothetical protein J2772_001818 [Chryseobacterium jejuense]|nr:hypothetical protein [Chryseobacterium jejuense]